MPATENVPFEALRGIGPFFALTPGGPPGGGRVTDLLGDAADLDAVIDLYGERLSTGRRDIAGSLFLQGWASRVVSVHLGCLALAGGVPDLGPANLTFAFPAAGPVELGVRDGRLADGAGAWDRLVAEHLAPLIAAVDERCGPGSRRLWGNLASAVAGALVMLRRKGFEVSTELPDGLREFGDWRDGGGGPRYRRRTCCNLFRVQGYGLCGDCVILRAPG